MRICLSLVLVAYFAFALLDFDAFYSNEGVLPISLMLEKSWNPYYFSLFNLSIFPGWGILLLLAGMAASMSLLVGYHTTLATFFCWILLVSLQNRNTLILQSGDDFLRMILLTGVFLPWGSHYSLDARHSSPMQNSVAHFGTALYLIQFASLYFFSALLKSSDEWRVNYTALYYAYSLDQMVLPLGKLLLPYPNLLKVLTALTFYVELGVPFLLFIPFRPALFRISAFVLLLLLQLGIGLTLYVGFFYLISISASIGLLPSFVMDKWDQLINRMDRWSFVKKWRGMEIASIQTQGAHYAKGFWGRTKSILSLSILFIILIWNTSTLTFVPYALGDTWAGVVHTFRLDQNWSMFAPGVFKDDGWYILEGKMASQAPINLLKEGNAVSYEKPANIVASFRTERWRKYYESLLFLNKSDFRIPYCQYARSRWNISHKEKIDTLRVVYMKELTLPDYAKPTIHKEVICSCW